MSGASRQDELQSFGLQSDVVDGGHLPVLQAAVEKLQFVGFLHDLKPQLLRSELLLSCRGVRACVCMPTDLLSCGRGVLFEAQRDGRVPQLLLQSLEERRLVSFYGLRKLLEEACRRSSPTFMSSSWQRRYVAQKSAAPASSVCSSPSRCRSLRDKRDESS